MGHFSCVVQEQGEANAKSDELESKLRDLHAQHYPDDSVTFSWREVPEGQMFTEGRQSTSSIIACVFTWETTLAEREQYMRSVCDIWTDTTNCTDHEVVVAITETNPI